MPIDWFTVGAQALNFLILVWLLKRFLYKPILNAIDVREMRISAELADADARKAEAQKERDVYQDKNERFDEQFAAMMSKATDDVKTERQRLLAEAREAADVLSAKRQEILRSEADSLNQALRQRTQQEVFAVARKALMDLAETSLEERMADVFVRRLCAMDDKQKEAISKVFGVGSEPVFVRSAFELPAPERAAIQKALNERLSTEVVLQFESAPGLISGIELSANGHKLAWSISDYLGSLEKGVDDLLKGTGESEPKVMRQVEAGVATKVASDDVAGTKQAKTEVKH